MSMTVGNVVFVGNIPYDVSERQMTEILEQVGPVKQFKLVMDLETGNGKGYGFCEFYDSETTALAVQRLNNREFFGPRKIRVEFPSNDPRRHQNYGHQEKHGDLASSSFDSSHASRYPNAPPHLRPHPLASNINSSYASDYNIPSTMPTTSPAPYSSSATNEFSAAANMNSVRRGAYPSSSYPPYNSASTIAPAVPSYPATATATTTTTANTTPSIPSTPSSTPLPATKAASEATQPYSVPSSVAKVFSSFTAQELLTMLTQLQTVVHVAPDEARRLLNANPALPYAAFQAMLLMNMIDSRVLQQVVLSMRNNPAPSASQAPQAPSRPVSATRPDTAMKTDSQNIEAKRMALINQLMALTPEQIHSLPPAQREQIIAIRRQHGAL
ncbi:mRNA cleavage and polyadenylation specificity factor complex subunit Ctf1 [Schizosaccharomyces cryophilus OY26]|uniref:mRNA cleavage and polyadenylation specificity factor complex subunit Ctf1 n=1 Tax=Schizosaccharomyces cryophilus (strain OY26 / ATCC MYA-4695 / CBS 11777 / NBRC 106824 / NRRL Y48691) TaxID=653667 RepID=S9XIT8_SCHCR|nr:mRNA cleavage and polyadenylation specificity factor complex subunit Ctf1 [Schizosaccharomyces cryophilus OY26]EPY53556.1 mRNA cleavage and polyadenylation specificity factor complex subunit Ctf1 [Schizosaccharomyces cryophilus OY26]